MFSNQIGDSDILPRVVITKLTHEEILHYQYSSKLKANATGHKNEKSNTVGNVSVETSPAIKKKKITDYSGSNTKRILRSTLKDTGNFINKCNHLTLNRLKCQCRIRNRSVHYSFPTLKSRDKLKTIKKKRVNVKKNNSVCIQFEAQQHNSLLDVHINSVNSREDKILLGKYVNDEVNTDFIVNKSDNAYKKEQVTKIDIIPYMPLQFSKGEKYVESNEVTSNEKKCKIENDVKSDVFCKKESKTEIIKSTKVECKKLLQPAEEDLKFEISNHCKVEKCREPLNEDLDSEIQIIEEIEHLSFKIKGTDCKLSKNKIQQPERPLSQGELINIYKTLTIDLKPQSTHTPLCEDEEIIEHSNPVQDKDKTNTVECSKANCISKIKVKPQEALGVINNIESDPVSNSESYTNKRIRYQQLTTGTDSTTEQICLLYPQYFNVYVDVRLNNLIHLLECVLKELYNHSDTLGTAKIPSRILENIKMDSPLCLTTLKKFSRSFVDQFKEIINTFQELHKSKMIPIIYLRLLKGDENLTSVNFVGMSVILKMFEIENFTCKYDIMSNKSYDETKEILKIYERWLESFQPTQNFCDPGHNSDLLNNGDKEICPGNVPVVESTNSFDKDISKKCENVNEQNSNQLLSTHDNLDSVILIQTEVQSEDINLVEKEDLDTVEIELVQSAPLDSGVSDNEECASFNQTTHNSYQVENNEENVPASILVKTFTSVASSSDYNMMSSEVTKRKIPSSSQSYSLESLPISLKEEDNSDKIKLFEQQEGECPIPCPSEACRKKLSVPCFYCKEPIGCEDLCQVEEDQLIGEITKEEYVIKLFSCKTHKTIQLEGNVVQDWDQVEDYEGPFQWPCCRYGCGNKALFICLCKTRAYCTLTCREEDWESNHHQDCSWSTDSALLYEASEVDCDQTIHSKT